MRFVVGKKRNIPWIVALVTTFFLIFIALFWVIETHLKPTLLAIAEAKALEMN